MIMRLKKRPEGARPIFIEKGDQRCVACDGPLRYDYKSSGRSIRTLDDLLWVECQIGYCTNGRCALVRKGIHPVGEWALAPAYERFDCEVIATCGIWHFAERMNREDIAKKLFQDYKLQMAPRTANRLFDLYGALVSGAQLEDPDIIRRLKKQRVAVLSLDGAEPIKGRDPVWFVRETTSGLALAAKAMVSCTTADLVELLAPVKRFLEKHGIRIVGVVSDAEGNIRAAVEKVFPGVPHQLCLIHYVKNLAKSLKGADSDLRKNVKKETRGLRPIERDIRSETEPGGSLSPEDGDTLLDICETIRSVLKDNGEPPFEPPGLKLFEKLTALQTALAEMAGKKGGPF